MPTWSARLATGVPVIDAQHELLFQRADALLAAMKERRSSPEVLALLDFLEGYVSEHFGGVRKALNRLSDRYLWPGAGDPVERLLREVSNGNT